MKWTNSYRSFGLKTKRSTGLKTIEHKQGRPDRLHVAGIACVRMANGRFGCTAPGRRRARPRVYVIK